MSFDPVQPFVTAINRIFGATSPVAVNKIRSYPAIIRLLQDFKFDQTEHPPSNFDIVYACAVIKYGELNKDEALVELFLKEEIKKAFDQAFYSNNYAKNIEVIEQTVNWQEQDWNTLGEQIKRLNIDFVQELEVFKSEFIKLVELSQTVAQRLTDQKIDDLHKKVDYISKKITQPDDVNTPPQKNYLYPEEFQPLIEEKIRSFCGREFVFTAVDSAIVGNLLTVSALTAASC